MPLLPALLFAIVVTQVPFLVTLYLSTLGWNALRPGERHFVGLGNYATLLSQAPFWKAVSHTLEFTSISVAGELVLGLLVALTINQNFPGRAAVRAAVLIPWSLPGIVIGLSWAWLALSAERRAGLVRLSRRRIALALGR